jgi:hypothetical protein
MKITRLPIISSYVESNSKGYGAHALRVDVGPLTLWYSYRTIVAFQVDGKDRVVSQNVWTRTTGKHLNAIEPDIKKRVNHETFMRLYKEQVDSLFQLS